MGIEIKEIDDRLEKQKDISKNFPELDAKEKGTLAGLDMPFNKEKGVTPEDVNKGMGARFDAEIAKAGNSSNKPELEKRKAELCKEIENTKDMKEKIALFQSFVDGLAPEVGTQIAEQKQRELQNTKSMEKEIKQDNDKKGVKKNPSTEEKGKDKEMIASIEKNPLTTFGKLSANILGNMVRDAIIDGQKDAMEGRKQLAKANQEIPPGDPEKEWPN